MFFLFLASCPAFWWSSVLCLRFRRGRGFRFAARRVAFSSGLAVATARFFFRPLFVIFAAVIGDIEPASFKNQARSRADGPLDRPFPPFLEFALLFGAGLECFIFY